MQAPRRKRKSSTKTRRPGPNQSRQLKKMTAALSHSRNPEISAAVVLARATALPLECYPMRYSGRSSDRPTAVAHPYEVHNSDFSSTGSSVDSQWPDVGRGLWGISYSPLMHTVEFVPNKAAAVWAYSAWFSDMNEAGGGFTDNLLFYLHQNDTRLLKFPVVKMVANPGLYVPGGVSQYYGGLHDGSHYFWIDGHSHGSSTVVSGTFTTELGGNIAAGLTVEFRLIQLYGNTERQIQSVTFGSDGATSTIPVMTTEEPGYYRIEMSMHTNSLASATYKATLHATGAGPNMVHRAIPHLEEREDLISSIAVTAASLMVSCRAPELYISGTLTGGVLDLTTDITRCMATGGDAYLRSISSSTGGRTIPFKNGMYTYLKSRTVNSIMPKPAFRHGKNGVVIDIATDLMPPDGWTMIGADVAETATGSNDVFITNCAGVEFYTTDSWFNAVPVQHTPAVQDEAAMILRQLPQFFDNPFHFLDIFKAVPRIGHYTLRQSGQFAREMSAVLTPGIRMGADMARIAAQVSSGASGAGGLARKFR